MYAGAINAVGTLSAQMVKVVTTGSAVLAASMATTGSAKRDSIDHSGGGADAPSGRRGRGGAGGRGHQVRSDNKDSATKQCLAFKADGQCKRANCKFAHYTPAANTPAKKVRRANGSEGKRDNGGDSEE